MALRLKMALLSALLGVVVIGVKFHSILHPASAPQGGALLSPSPVYCPAGVSVVSSKTTGACALLP